MGQAGLADLTLYAPRVTTSLHTAHSEGVRALLSSSYPSTLCEVMVWCISAWV